MMTSSSCERPETKARILANDFRVGKNTSVLDIGCGPGRIPIGILDLIGPVDYTGIDVQAVSIRWCKRYIERKHPSFKFIHIDASNERYNERGVEIGEDFRFPFPDKRFDVIVLFSVFTHMNERDMRIYLRECKRILKDAGRIYATAFVEEGVPNISVNPPGYIPGMKGPLHVVMYDKEYLFGVLRECGVSIDEFKHHSHDTQTTLYLSRAT